MRLGVHRLWPVVTAAVCAAVVVPRVQSQQPAPVAPQTVNESTPPRAVETTARIDAPVGTVKEHPVKRALDLANASYEQTQKVRDYAFTFVKRELVDGRLTEHEAMHMKIRREPFSVYLHTLGPKQPKGQEAIFINGRNDNKALVHVTGLRHKLVGMLSLDPRCPEMMEGNRYPITTAGFENMLLKVIKMYQSEMRCPDCDVQIFVGAKVDGRPCSCVQVSHPTRRPELFFHLSRIFYDEESNVPIRWEAYDWASQPGGEPQLVEEYTYRNLNLNPGLTDVDFDVNNPAYSFK